MAKSDPDALSWSRLSRKPLQEPKSPATENWNETASSEEAGVPTKERPTRAIAAARRTAMARLGPNVAPMTSRPVPVSLHEYFSFSWHLAHKCTRGSTQKAPVGLPRPTRSVTDGLRGSEHVRGPLPFCTVERWTRFGASLASAVARRAGRVP